MERKECLLNNTLENINIETLHKTFLDAFSDMFIYSIAYLNDTIIGYGIINKETGAHGVQLVSGSARISAHTFYKSCGYEESKEQKNFRKMF